jgi:hypothetical protein
MKPADAPLSNRAGLFRRTEPPLISSYSPITSAVASSPNGRPQCWQCAGRWSSRTSAVSASARACPLCPGLASPGREPSRLTFRSVDGGFDDVRDVLSGRLSRSNRSINPGFVSRSSSSRFIGSVNHRPPPMARGWVITIVQHATALKLAICQVAQGDA